MTLGTEESKSEKSHGHFSELLKVEGKLSLREPTGLFMGIGVPIVLVIVFGLIGIASPGNVPGTSYTVIGAIRSNDYGHRIYFPWNLYLA